MSRTVATRRQSPWGQVARAAGRMAWNYGVNKLTRYAAKRVFTNRGSSNKKNVSSGRTVTYQRDIANVYRRRRMPRRKRRPWVKFVHKVRAVTEKDLGTISVVRNSWGVNTASLGGQGTGGAELYGLDGSAFIGADDLRAIVQSYNSGSLPANSRFRFCSGVLDMTFTCIADPDDPESHTMELDLYEMVYRKHSRFPNVDAMFVDAAADTPTFGTAAPLSMVVVGATPFQFPQALSTVKILKKKKYFLANGHSATYQIRDPRNRIFDTNLIDDHIGTDAKPGWTRIVYFVFKHVPTASAQAPAISLAVSATRTYKVKKFENAASSDGLV